MNRTWVRSVLGVALAAAVLVPAHQAQAQPPGNDPETAVIPAGTPLDAPAAVEPADRDRILGAGWQRSTDRVWTTSGDGDGFHVLVADAATGYAWRTAATLSEPGFAVDQWVGNACLAGRGSRLVVVYAPRTFTNRAELFDRGAFTAVVDLDDGTVIKLPLLSSLAYFSPGCGNTDTALVTQDGGTDLASTRVVPVDVRTATVGRPIQVPGQLTSAVPTGAGIVAADRAAIVRLAADGTRTVLAATSGVPFGLTVDGRGSVVFMERDGATGVLRRVDPRGHGARPTTVGSGPLDRVGLAVSGDRRVFLVGEVEPAAPLPPTVQRLAVPKDAVVSSTGEAVLTSVVTSRRPHPSAFGDPTVLTRPVRIEMTVRRTGQRTAFTAVPTAASPAGRVAHPKLRVHDGVTTTAGSPSDPVEAERYCSVPRNDPHNQVMQPKPRQVEWAVDQAVTGSLSELRPANWKNLGMPAYTPQGLFPPRALLGGGRVPAQVFLGVIAQDSNMWQAPGSVLPGVTGNPLIGNYYGLDLYDGDDGNDWDINWLLADCGYGVTQLTDGMRLQGRERPGETALPYDQQRAVALDFAANVAAGLRVLQEKWNQTRSAGLTINNGDPSKIENWFYAVWAYNSGFHPESEAALNNGAWGVGWSNNPVNPKYRANRTPFLEYGYADAAHPQDWPYPEKVMGWAGHPVEVLEGPDTLVAGFRPAWWNGDAITGPQNRALVKPPVAQFCDATNNCDTTAPPIPPDVEGEPAGPCAHLNDAGRYDLKCWYNRPSTWKPDCSYSCGNELLRFDPGYPYQADGTSYPPNCALTGLPAGALIIDDQPDSMPIVRPGCSRPFTNQGTFGLDFGADASGNYPSKVDFHQLGAGFAGHFWYAHTRTADLRGNSMRVTGTWTLNRQLTGWARVLVHMPDHGAHTQQAAYEVDLGNGTRTRVLLQRTLANKWVSLGSFPFAGTPKVRLSSVTHDGDNGAAGRPIESEDIAFDAVAFQVLPGKPRNIVVSLGDSYSSGEGASVDGGGDYYRETDNNGDDPLAQNACHRSRYAWSRLGVLADAAGTIGQRSDAWDPTLEHHLIACSGAQTENLLPYHSVPQDQRPRNAFGEEGTTSYGELSQPDKGFLDENTTLVTLSIGGNDARFAPILQKCILLLTDVCQDATLDGDTQPLRLEEPLVITNQVKPSIVTVLVEIRKKAPNAKVLLMGYPLLFEADGQCVPGIGTAEAPWLRDTGNHLATEMNNATNLARAAGVDVRFSDPRDDFAGQAVCGNPEKIHAVVAPWNRTPGEAPSAVNPSQQSFHPKIDGQQLYANSMNATLREMGL